MSSATPASPRRSSHTVKALEIDVPLELDVQFATRSRFVPSPHAVRRWAAAAQAAPLRMTVRIVGAPEARRLNLQHRQRDYATNVLTYVYGNDGAVLCGDLVICAPVVAREAREQCKSLSAHYAHLVVHGLLHLQGHDHDNERDAQSMERRERRIMKSLRYGDPYAMRVAGPARAARQAGTAIKNRKS